MVLVQSLKSTDLQDLPLEVRALAVASNRFQTPPSIVVTPQAFEEFAAYNSLEPKVRNILKTSNNIREAVAQIYLLFMTSEIPKDVEQAIKDGVNALSYGNFQATNSNAILKQEKPEYLMMFVEGSKDRYVHPDEVLTAMKHFWALLHNVKTLSKGFQGLKPGFVVIHAIKNWPATGFAILDKEANRIVVKAVQGLVNLNQGLSNPNMDSYVVENNKVESSVVDQTSIIELTKQGVVRRQCLIDSQKINDRLVLKIARVSKLCEEYDLKAFMFAIDNEDVLVLRFYKEIPNGWTTKTKIYEDTVHRDVKIEDIEQKNIEEPQRDVHALGEHIGDIDIEEAVDFITKVEHKKTQEERTQEKRESMKEETDKAEAQSQEIQLEEETIQQKIELPSAAESLAITAGNVMVSSLEFASLALKKALKEVTNRDISLELSPEDFIDMASEALEDVGAFLEPDYRESIKKLLELRSVVLSGKTPSFSEIGDCLDGALRVVKWLSNIKTKNAL